MGEGFDEDEEVMDGGEVSAKCLSSLCSSLRLVQLEATLLIPSRGKKSRFKCIEGRAI